jgi:sortase A
VAIAALLLSILLAVPACGGLTTAQDGGEGQSSQSATETAKQTETTKRKQEGTTVQAATPEDVLSEEERTGAPEFKDWKDPAAEGYNPETSKFFVGTDTSTGAIPSVKPFNFGKNPGGPEDKTLKLTIPKLGLEGVPAFDGISEEKLKKGTVHVPVAGFPWQEGANTYIAGHRIGYPGTPSDKIFYDLPKLAEGDEITVTDAAGKEYVYRVTMEKVVGPQNVEVMNPVEGKSVITLQTCTLPNYEDRIIVQGELVEGPSA